MSSPCEELLLGPLARMLELRHQLSDARQLATATRASIAPELVERFYRSTATRRFRPLYDELLQICRGLSTEHAESMGMTPEILESLRRLADDPPPATVQREDPLIMRFLRHVAVLDEELRNRVDSHEPKAMQLVLQFPENVECEDIGDLEDLIASAIGNPDDEPDQPHLVDGNSYGAGTIEIFVDSDDAPAAFDRIQSALRESGLLKQMTAAYRESRESEFIVIWPPDYSGSFEL